MSVDIVGPWVPYHCSNDCRQAGCPGHRVRVIMTDPCLYIFEREVDAPRTAFEPPTTEVVREYFDESTWEAMEDAMEMASVEAREGFNTSRLSLRNTETQEELDNRRIVYRKYPRAYQDGKGSIWTDDFYTCDSLCLSVVENVLDCDPVAWTETPTRKRSAANWKIAAERVETDKNR